MDGGMERSRRRRSTAAAALLLALLSAMATTRLVDANPPVDLSNFQNEFVCDQRIRIVRPRNVQDIQDAVRLHTHVMATGEGHSWNKPFFCASLPGAQGKLPEEPASPEERQEEDKTAEIKTRGLLQDTNPFDNLESKWTPTGEEDIVPELTPTTVSLQKPEEDDSSEGDDTQSQPQDQQAAINDSATDLDQQFVLELDAVEHAEEPDPTLGNPPEPQITDAQVTTTPGNVQDEEKPGNKKNDKETDKENEEQARQKRRRGGSGERKEEEISSSGSPQNSTEGENNDEESRSQAGAPTVPEKDKKDREAKKVEQKVKETKEMLKGGSANGSDTPAMAGSQGNGTRCISCALFSQDGSEGHDGDEEQDDSFMTRVAPMNHREAPSVSALAGPNATSANIILTTVRSMGIRINEEEESAWIDAGIKVKDVLDYLGNFVTETAPRGWTLPAFPWFIFQSIGGAVATGTHGSSLKYNSLSDQVLAFQVVLANGTLAEITPESHPFLMKAFRVSLGKLGIITSMKFKIVKEQPVTRTQTKGVLPSTFIDMMKEAQEMYKETRDLPDWMNETQIFWIVQHHEFMIYSFERGDSKDRKVRKRVLRHEIPDETTTFESMRDMSAQTGDPKVPASDSEDFSLEEKLFEDALKYLKDLNKTRINSELPEEAQSRSDSVKIGGNHNDSLGVARGTEWELPETKPMNVLYGGEAGAGALFTANIAALSKILPNATVEAHESYISMPEVLLASLVQGTLYDQYEVSIPVDRAADCFEGMLNMLYSDDIDGKDAELRSIDKGFRTAPLIRFVGKEDGLLSPTYDMPHVYINLEDYIFYNRGRKRNENFFKVMAFLRGDPSCSPARLHWGKHGWPEQGCWNGAEEYPETWCDFGCAVRALDPFGKFTDSAADRWNWDGADLEYCCSEDGYDSWREGCNCSVRRVKPADECPPSPFYTTR